MTMISQVLDRRSRQSSALYCGVQWRAATKGIALMSEASWLRGAPLTACHSMLLIASGVESPASPTKVIATPVAAKASASFAEYCRSPVIRGNGIVRESHRQFIIAPDRWPTQFRGLALA